jgi:hypothetical protein
MDALAVVLFALVLFSHSWNLLGKTDLKLPGIIAGTVSIVLILLVVFKPLNLMTGASPVSIALCLLLFTIYAVSLAAIGLWGFDSSSLGYYSALHALGRILLAVSFLSIGGMIGIAACLTQIILVVLFILLAIHLIITTHPLRKLTGWFFLIGSVIIFLMQLMGILGFIKMAA